MKNAFTAGLLCAVLMLSGCGGTAVRYPAVQEYLPGQGNIQGHGITSQTQCSHRIIICQ